MNENEYICVASRGRNTAPDGGIEQHLEPCPTPGKTRTAIPYDDYNSRFPQDLTKVGAVRQTFSKNAARNGYKLIEPNGRIRRLTPTECARLQTVPNWYKWVVSETQQYKMLGNGWTIEVIKHIFSFLPDRFKQ